jgi:hypothetical protein
MTLTNLTLASSFATTHLALAEGIRHTSLVSAANQARTDYRE